MRQARRKTTPKRRQSSAPRSSPCLGMLLIGLVIGLIMGVLVVGVRSDNPTAIGSGIKQVLSSRATATPPKRAKSTATTTATNQPPVPAAKTEFGFYDALPEMERLIPDDVELQEKTASPAPPAQHQAERETQKNAQVVTQPQSPHNRSPHNKNFYMLQAGSFTSVKDADRLKATLALNGMVSKIQRVTIHGKGDLYRVRLGPYTDTAQLKADNQRLKTMGVAALRLKVSG